MDGTVCCHVGTLNVLLPFSYLFTASSSINIPSDPNPLISLPSLQKAYDSLSAKTSALEDADDLLGDDAEFNIDIDIDPEEVTVDSHFRVVGAFEMPGWRFDNVKGTFGL